MKRLATHLKSYLLILIFVLLIVGQPVWAQGQNLLSNPGFEAPFTPYTDASPARQVAQGWLPWYIGGGQSASENVYPEYYPASNVSDGLGVPRIRSGSDAQQYLSFFATHDAGVYQRVTGITQGTELRFSAYIYVWSTSFDDVNESETDGGVIVQVGIDPSGGTSGDSPNIIWSAPTVSYDAYNQYNVIATASSTAVTVFVRSTVSIPVKNNNIYVDDASLVVNNLPTSTPTLTPQPPTATLTLTPTARPTNTPQSATNTPDDLGIVTATVQPSSTPTSVTNTLVPATLVVVPTDTLSPSATFTPPPTLPPTSTSLPASPTPIQEIPGDSEFPGKVIHTVQAGDTVGQLATLYGSSIDAIITSNGLNQSAFIRVGQALVVPVRLSSPATSTPTVTPIVPVIVPTATPTTTVYIVQAGDTLNRLAVRYNTSVAAIAQLNGITNVNIIRTGQQLIIPIGGVVVVPPTTPPSQQTTYVVQPGDTLFRIALRFATPLSRLVQVNGILDPNRVFVGQVLVIP